MQRELTWEELTCHIDPKQLGFTTTDSLKPLEGIMGQQRAVEAFEFGLKVKKKGYNIYMAGPSGVGKTTYASLSTQRLAKTEQVPYDWCYVYHFEDPRTPLALRFQPGEGRQFQDDMAELVDLLEVEIQKAFSSEDYDLKKNEISK